MKTFKQFLESHDDFLIKVYSDIGHYKGATLWMYDMDTKVFEKTEDTGSTRHVNKWGLGKRYWKGRFDPIKKIITVLAPSVLTYHQIQPERVPADLKDKLVKAFPGKNKLIAGHEYVKI